MLTELESRLAAAVRALLSQSVDRTTRRVASEALAAFDEMKEKAIVEELTDEHTNEPWSAEPPGRSPTSTISIIDADGKQICSVRYRLPPGTARSNARRIVACINACVGIPTPELEAIECLAEELRDLRDHIRVLSGSDL